MGYTILPYNDSQVYGLQRYIVDTAEDIDSLPTGGPAGSKATVANTGEVYMLNNQHQWKLQSAGSGSGGMSQADVEQAVEDILATKDYATEEYVGEALSAISENDPTIPSWAKSETKPTYTAQEVGALPDDTVIPTVPTNVSAFVNDAGYLTQHQDISGKANSADLAAVATSGSYNDLNNTPNLSNYAPKNNPVLTGNLAVGTELVANGGTGAVATGWWSQATGRSAHAEGQSSIASGWVAHAEGLQTKAIGAYSHAEGRADNSGDTTVGNVTYLVGATGPGGHSEGTNTIAAGAYSHAEGQGTVAIGCATHVSGTYNRVDADFSAYNEWVSGTAYEVNDLVKVTSENSIDVYKCRTANSDAEFDSNNWTLQYPKLTYAEIIGNGTAANNRSNARTLDWNGNEVLAGGLTVGANGITIGSTTITEAQLQALLNLLNN